MCMRFFLALDCDKVPPPMLLINIVPNEEENVKPRKYITYEVIVIISEIRPVQKYLCLL